MEIHKSQCNYCFLSLWISFFFCFFLFSFDPSCGLDLFYFLLIFLSDYWKWLWIFVQKGDLLKNFFFLRTENSKMHTMQRWTHKPNCSFSIIFLSNKKILNHLRFFSAAYRGENLDRDHTGIGELCHRRRWIRPWVRTLWNFRQSIVGNTRRCWQSLAASATE